VPIRKVVIDKANRLYQLPPTVAEFVPSRRNKGLVQRNDLIDLASFRWPISFTPEFNTKPNNLALASNNRIELLKETLADWLSRTHKVKIVPGKELFIGGGISNLAFLLSLAYIDAGDVAFVPGLGIPAYRSAVTACNGVPIGYTVSVKNDWEPQFDRITAGLGRVARLLFINSPHNPTGFEFTEKAITSLAKQAGKLNVLLVNDAAYQSVSARTPVSLLDVKGGRRVGIELASFSYQFGLPPLPFGYAVGNREAINGLKRSARLLPSYLPSYFVDLALEAIQHYPSPALTSIREQIHRAAAEAGDLLDHLKLKRSGQPTVPFVWAKIDRRTPSTDFAKTVLRRFGIQVTPGLGFGSNGEGFIRLSLLAGLEALSKATERIKNSRTVIRKG